MAGSWEMLRIPVGEVRVGRNWPTTRPWSLLLLSTEPGLLPPQATETEVWALLVAWPQSSPQYPPIFQNGENAGTGDSQSPH